MAERLRCLPLLVRDEVYQISGEALPFPDQTFDRVAIIDFLEHIPDDRRFVDGYDTG